MSLKFGEVKNDKKDFQKSNKPIDLKSIDQK